MMPFQHKDQVVNENADDEPMRIGDGDDFDMLDAIAEDLLHAIESKDRSLLRDALEALCEHVLDRDEVQDHEEFQPR